MTDVTSFTERRFNAELEDLKKRVRRGEVADPMKALREMASRHKIDEETALTAALGARVGQSIPQ